MHNLQTQATINVKIRICYYTELKAGHKWKGCGWRLMDGFKRRAGRAQCERLTSFSFRSLASRAASRWAAKTASSSSLNFSSSAPNWAEITTEREG